MSDEARDLRDRLEATQTELKQAKEELLAARAESVTLKERVEFLQWSLNGGHSKDLVLQLAEARAEVGRLKEWVATEPAARAPAQRRVCLIAVAGVVIDEQGLGQTQYVGFVVSPEGEARDLIRSFNLEAAKRAVDEKARELGVGVEDFT